jgi:FkbM family methyltransferase
MSDINKLLNLEFRESKAHGGQWLWPADDTVAWGYLNKAAHRHQPHRIAELCLNRNLVIQAGGNAGLYPKQYSKLFKTTITVEPDYRNFICLAYNVPEDNVFKFQACLGNESKFLSIGYNDRWDHENRGAMKVTGSGLIPQITIDSLNVAPDLIHLDIEGYEAFALLGAEKTIKSHKPMIVLETNGSGDEYGWTQSKIDNLLFSWGYKILENWGHDPVYISE